MGCKKLLEVGKIPGTYDSSWQFYGTFYGTFLSGKSHSI